MKITRRYGTPPVQRCNPDNVGCPDVLGLENGDYAVIGKIPDIRHIPVKELTKHGADMADDEMMVIVPAAVIHAAAQDIVRNLLKETTDE